MSITVVAIPKILREKLTEEGSEALVGLLNKTNVTMKENVLTIVEEKFERRLAHEIGSAKSEMIKWMFIFTLGQFWAIVSTLFVFFGK